MRLLFGLACAGLMVSGCGGGGDDVASSAKVAAAPTPQLEQTNTYQTMGIVGAGDVPLQFNAATKAGDTIWVVATVSDIIQNYTITVTDTQGNTYTQILPQQNDGAPGYQTVAQFFASNIVGDATTPDTITVSWPVDNYKGVLIAEVSGTSAAPLVGHAENTQSGLGTANVTAGPIAVSAAQTPALLVALSMNTSGGSSDTGGSGAGAAAAGPGMSEEGVFWNWGANLATFVTEPITQAQTVSAVFDAPDVDDYVTVAAVFH